jgi:O-antigen/teichoic acid export membrane protein
MWQKIQRYITQLRTPLYRNSIYLFGATVVSAAFGFLFWFLGARATNAADVGVAQASIGSALLLISLADIGLGTALPYYAARSSTPHEFVNASISAGWLFSSVAVVIFWIGLPVFAPNLVILRADPFLLIFFFLFTTINFVLGIQDAAMLSQQNGKYVFLRTVACNMPPSLLLLLLLMVEHSSRVMFIAFVVPNIVVGLYVGVRVFPRFFEKYQLWGRPNLPAILKMTRFGLFNYVNNIIWGLSSQLLPLIAINSLTPSVTGYFLTNLTLMNLVLAVPKTVSISMFIEGARNRENLSAITLRSLMFMLLLITPLIFGISVFGGTIINLFGPNYVMMTTLRLMMLSVVPFTLNTVIMNYLRLQKMYLGTIAFSGIAAVSVLFCTFWLARMNGPEGIALGLLLGYSIAAIVGLLWAGTSLRKRRTGIALAASSKSLA